LARRSSDQNYYPNIGPSVPYDPAFIPPFTIELESPEINGWFSFLFPLRMMPTHRQSSGPGRDHRHPGP